MKTAILLTTEHCHATKASGTRDNPPLALPWLRYLVAYSLQNQQTVHIPIKNPPRGKRQLGWASCVASTGRVTLAIGRTFLQISAYTRLNGTTLGLASVK